MNPAFLKQLPRHFYAFTTGLAAGGIVGTVGWGGAQVLIPSLTANLSFAGYSQLSATGISLTSLSTSTLTSGGKFWREGQVNVPMALLVGLPAVVSARLGTLWAKKLPGNTLALIFNVCSIVLIPTHFVVQERAKLRRAKQQPLLESSLSTPDIPRQTGNVLELEANRDISPSFPLLDIQEMNPGTMQFIVFGLFQGVLSSLMGVGGLPLSMSFVTEFTDLDHHHVQGTAICAVIPSIITSAASRIHAIPLGPAGAVCAGAILGGYGGANLALALNDEQLRLLYMGSLVVFGGRSMVGAATNLRHLLRKGGL